MTANKVATSAPLKIQFWSSLFPSVHVSWLTLHWSGWESYSDSLTIIIILETSFAVGEIPTFLLFIQFLYKYFFLRPAQPVHPPSWSFRTTWFLAGQGWWGARRDLRLRHVEERRCKGPDLFLSNSWLFGGGSSRMAMDGGYLYLSSGRSRPLDPPIYQ